VCVIYSIERLGLIDVCHIERLGLIKGEKGSGWQMYSCIHVFMYAVCCMLYAYGLMEVERQYDI
jgi:hypothetical protein